MTRTASIAALLVSTLCVACSGDGKTTEPTGSTTDASAGTGTETGSTGEPTTGATGPSSGTTAGTTGEPPVACDSQGVPDEGAPCPEEGQFCGAGCEDPCHFCAFVECREGTWQPGEAFPAPCAGCEDLCSVVVAAGCAGGPPDLTACIEGCEATLAGPCELEFNQMRACIVPARMFTCDAMDRPTVVGCEERFEALYACMMP